MFPSSLFPFLPSLEFQRTKRERKRGRWREGQRGEHSSFRKKEGSKRGWAEGREEEKKTRGERE